MSDISKLQEYSEQIMGITMLSLNYNLVKNAINNIPPIPNFSKSNKLYYNENTILNVETNNNITKVNSINYFSNFYNIDLNFMNFPTSAIVNFNYDIGYEMYPVITANTIINKYDLINKNKLSANNVHYEVSKNSDDKYFTILNFNDTTKTINTPQLNKDEIIADVIISGDCKNSNNSCIKFDINDNIQLKLQLRIIKIK